jgi:hypothetical protein
MKKIKNIANPMPPEPKISGTVKYLLSVTTSFLQRLLAVANNYK